MRWESRKEACFGEEPFGACPFAIRESPGIGTPVTPSPGDSDYSPADQITGIDKKKKRLEKNRLAAKQCRQKKKEYIKCLEERVRLLEQHNKELWAELRKAKPHQDFSELQAKYGTPVAAAVGPPTTPVAVVKPEAGQ